MRVRLGGNGRTWVAFLAFALLFVLMASSGSAQSIATILGVVKDSSGAVVPQAKVTVTNTDTADSRTVTTDDDGSYRISALRPGHYNVRVEKEGFKTQTQTALTLDVAQQLVINGALQVGSAAQEVTVSGEAPIVNTTTSSLGGLVNDEQMADLPVNGRNYVDLSLLQPGMSAEQFRTAPGGGGGNSGVLFSSNGASIQSNIFMLDGTILNNQLASGTSSLGGNTIGMDGIKEYKVVSSAYDASYPLVMGSQMVMVSKGGTNQFHGDVFEYLRNSSMNARNFFDTAASSGGKRLPAFRRNNFGASVGGPIQKDKTFFFAVYEGLREHTGVTINDTVPKAICHTALVPNGANFAFDNEADAQACSPGAGTVGLHVTSVIPGKLKPFIDLYPTANNGTTGFTTPFTTINTSDYGQFRLDHTFSTNDTFFARYTVEHDYSLNAGTFPEVQNFGGPNRNNFVTLGETHIFSPTLLNTARFSFSQTLFVIDTITNPAFNGSQYKFTGEGEGVGGLTVTGLSTMGGLNWPSYHTQDVFSISDDMFWTKGHHALKFGTLLNRFTVNTLHSQGLVGVSTFPSLTTFMQGFYRSIRGIVPAANDTERLLLYYTAGFYVQDDWRLTPRLTVNLGLRYEFHTTYNDVNGKNAGFRDFSNPSASFTPGPAMQNPSYRAFSPRIGLAWDVFGNGKTAIRAGAGYYYDIGNAGTLFFDMSVAQPPFSVYNTVANNNNTSFVIPVPFVYTDPGHALAMQTVDYYQKQPLSLQYNLTVDQQLPFGIGLAVSYVGFQGRHLYRSYDANPFPPTSFVNGTPNWSPWVCGGVVMAAPSAPCTSTQLPNNPAYNRINPNFGQVVWTISDSTSTYNALQLLATKHLNKGLEFQGAFTWSHSTDGTIQQGFGGEACGGNELPSNEYLPGADRGPSCFNKKYNFALSLLYHVPNIKSDNIAAKFLHGWWMANIFTAQTGLPFNPALSVDRYNEGIYSTIVTPFERPNLSTTTATATLSGIPYTFVPFDPKTVITGDPNHWFNPLMFSLAPAGQGGNEPMGLLTGPGLTTWHFSLGKDTRLPFLGEQGNLELRAEFFNILNKANFAVPSSPIVFAGTVTDGAGFTEAPSGASTTNPLGTSGKISSTFTTSRQIQLALKIIF